jgi:PIN domain nuclease of toxin-antitoxin system
VKLLLDTHVILWSADEPNRLRPAARTAISDGTNQVFVSVISAWEIAIKQSVGKLTLDRPAELWFPEALRRGIDVAEISLTAALRVRALPMHHRDPFDRLLVAQAIVHGMTIATPDPLVRQYPARTMW